MKKYLALMLSLLMLFAAGCQAKQDDLTLPEYEEVFRGGSRYSRSTSYTGDTPIYHFVTRRVPNASVSVMQGCFYAATPGKDFENSDEGAVHSILEGVFAVDYNNNSGSVQILRLLLQFEEKDCQFSDLILSCPSVGNISLTPDENNFVDIPLEGVSKQNPDKKVTDCGMKLSGTIHYDGQEISFEFDI